MRFCWVTFYLKCQLNLNFGVTSIGIQCRRLIESRIGSTEWYRFQWPCITYNNPKPSFYQRWVTLPIFGTGYSLGFAAILSFAWHSCWPAAYLCIKSFSLSGKNPSTNEFKSNQQLWSGKSWRPSTSVAYDSDVIHDVGDCFIDTIGLYYRNTIVTSVQRR